MPKEKKSIGEKLKFWGKKSETVLDDYLTAVINLVNPATEERV